MDFFDDPIWDEWDSKNQMMLAPGREFFDFCANGVEVFYVTSRDQATRPSTTRWIICVSPNRPMWTNKHVTVLRDTSNKQNRQDEMRRRTTSWSFLAIR